MAQESGDFVERFDFSGVKTAGDVMGVFIKVARRYPGQAELLLDKYAGFIQHEHPAFNDIESRNFAKMNLINLSSFYGQRTTSLLQKTYGC